jgi:hypothetical protein
VSVPSWESDSECASPFEAKGGGEHHSLADEGGGGNSADWTESLALCLFCAKFSGRGWLETIEKMTS